MKKEIQVAIGEMLSDKSVSDIIKHACGEKLGSGTYRTVYVMKDFPQYVLKIEGKSNGGFANATEWSNYTHNELWRAFSIWLATCHGISEHGTILVQDRVEHRAPKEYPKLIPSMFTDTKYKNFGWIGDRFVCCDYSYLKLCDFKMVKAKWRKK